MYIKRNYSFWMTFNWTKKPFLFGLLYSGIIIVLFNFFKLEISIPWQPVGVIGISVAFYLGFKNNSAYDRTWEARKIYGGIVNDSRSFAAAVISFTQGENHEGIKKELIYRHIAWLTALRHQLRLSRTWEHAENRLNGLYSPTVCEDYDNKLFDELRLYLTDEEKDQIKKRYGKIAKYEYQKNNPFFDFITLVK